MAAARPGDRHAESEHPLRHTSLRYFNVVGSGDPTVYDTSPHNLFPLVFEALIEGRTPRINGDDYDTADGTNVRDYVHVADIAAAHVVAAQRLDGGEPVEPVYNLGSQNGLSVREIMDAMARVTGIDFTPEIAPRRPGDPDRIVATGELAARDLDWANRYSVDEMVRTGWEARRAAGRLAGPRGRGAGAHHEPGRDGRHPPRAVRDPVHERGDRRRAERIELLADRRQRRAVVRGIRDIVEADDADVVGDRSTGLGERPQGAEGHLVVRGEQRGDLRSLGEGGGRVESGCRGPVSPQRLRAPRHRPSASASRHPRSRSAAANEPTGPARWCTVGARGPAGARSPRGSGGVIGLHDDVAIVGR